MIHLDLQKLVGQWVMVQFRPGTAMVVAGKPNDSDWPDMCPRSPKEPGLPMLVDAYPFLVGEREGRIVLLYQNPAKPEEMMVVHHIPLELVAFVTSVDNPTQPSE